MKLSTKKAIRILTGKSSRTLPEGFNKNLADFDLNRLAQQFGFLPQVKSPQTLFLFVTKGGVLKSSLTLNLARVAAWHGLKTLVIGLDVQCDISRALGGFSENEDSSLDEALSTLNIPQGLYQFFQGQVALEDLVQPTDLPHLSYICETPELATLEQALHLRPRREYWLKEAVIEPLKQNYDLILIDGAPSWSLLTTNALVASDGLISPVECKINNYRNLSMFRSFIKDFKKDLKVEFPQVFIPTRLSPHRRLSRDIFEKYTEELPRCVNTPIKDSVQGEEASALKLSVCEHQPTSPAAQEMRRCLKESFELLNQTSSHTKRPDFKETHVTQP